MQGFPEKLMVCTNTYHWLCLSCSKKIMKSTEVESKLCDMHEGSESCPHSQLKHIWCHLCDQIVHLPRGGTDSMLTPTPREVQAMMTSPTYIVDILIFLVESAETEIKNAWTEMTNQEARSRHQELTGGALAAVGGIALGVGGAVAIPFTFGLSSTVIATAASVAIGGLTTSAVGTHVAVQASKEEMKVLEKKQQVLTDWDMQLQWLQKIFVRRLDEIKSTGTAREDAVYNSQRRAVDGVFVNEEIFFILEEAIAKIKIVRNALGFIQQVYNVIIAYVKSFFNKKSKLEESLQKATLELKSSKKMLHEAKKKHLQYLEEERQRREALLDKEIIKRLLALLEEEKKKEEERKPLQAFLDEEIKRLLAFLEEEKREEERKQREACLLAVLVFLVSHLIIVCVAMMQY